MTVILPKPEHIDFIKDQMRNLEQYDSKRPEGHVYEFHLHSYRVADNMKSFALAMGYSADMADTLYWATLPHDIGKMALPLQIWDLKDKPTDEEKSQRRTHTWRGVHFIQDHFGEDFHNDPFLKLVSTIMENHHETMNGQGPLGKTAKDLSQEVRMACICDAFDGWSVARPHFGDRDISPMAVIKRIETEKEGQFDSKLLQIFKETKVKGASKPCPLKRFF